MYVCTHIYTHTGSSKMMHQVSKRNTFCESRGIEMCIAATCWSTQSFLKHVDACVFVHTHNGVVGFPSFFENTISWHVPGYVTVLCLSSN